MFFQEIPVRVNAKGHVYGQVDLDEDSDKSTSNYHRPYGIARRPSVLLSPDYTGKCQTPYICVDILFTFSSVRSSIKDLLRLFL